MIKRRPLRESARGMDCTAMIAGVCNHNPETTVLAHLNGSGLSCKSFDIHACYACSDCHQWLDGGYVKSHTRDDRDLEHLRAVVKTQKIMVDNGLVKW